MASLGVLHRDILLIVLKEFSLGKLRQLKYVNRSWCGACRFTLTSTAWLVKGKSDGEIRDLVTPACLRRTADVCGLDYLHIGQSFTVARGDEWSRISQIASMTYYHTFTLPLPVMTWPGGACFSDGFGGLECRVGILHSLLIEDDCIVRILLETKDGMFSSLRDIVDHVIRQRPYYEYVERDDKEIEEEFEDHPDEFVLSNLLPCIKVGKAYVSGWDENDKDGVVCLMHAVNPLYGGPHCVDETSTSIRTKFIF